MDCLPAECINENGTDADNNVPLMRQKELENKELVHSNVLQNNPVAGVFRRDISPPLVTNGTHEDGQQSSGSSVEVFHEGSYEEILPGGIAKISVIEGRSDLGEEYTHSSDTAESSMSISVALDTELEKALNPSGNPLLPTDGGASDQDNEPNSDKDNEPNSDQDTVPESNENIEEQNEQVHSPPRIPRDRYRIYRRLGISLFVLLLLFTVLAILSGQDIVPRNLRGTFAIFSCITGSAALIVFMVTCCYYQRDAIEGYEQIRTPLENVVQEARTNPFLQPFD